MTSKSRDVKARFVHRLLRARDYQPRPELDAVCRWWRTSHTGICALEGIGGAGKTAVTDRFLRTIPGVMAPDPDIPQDAVLPRPNHVFVFSFYDASNPETFFWDLALWLIDDGSSAAHKTLADLDRRRARGERPPYGTVSTRLAHSQLALIVLDGVEKVQNDGNRGAFGALLDGHLKEFFCRAADGYMPTTGIVLTSRFPLSDLYEQDPRPGVAPKRLPLYRTIPVEQLDSQACTDLLTRVGVRGSERELARIAADCGYHALTVDLFGGYIARFLAGEAGAALASSPITALIPPAADGRSSYVHDQAARFARVTARYHEALTATDPAALALMQRVCLFRLGVTEEFLYRLFTGPGKVEMSGASLAALDRNALHDKLEFLRDIHLLEATATTDEGAALLTAHPAVREGFAGTVDADSARVTHDAARHGMLASLARRPGELYPSEPLLLDQLEEVVFHTKQAHQIAEAHLIYRDRMGGFQHLGWALGDFERGVRVCHTLLDGLKFDRGEHLTLAEQGLVGREWALYLAGLGQVGQALHQLRRSVPALWWNDPAHNDVAAEIYMLAGRPGFVLNALEISTEMRACACALVGDVGEAVRSFNSALPSSRWIPSAGLHAGRESLALPAIHHCLFLLRLGLFDEVERGARHITRDVADAVRWASHMYSPASDLLLAEVAISQGRFTDADDLIRAAQDWALDRGASELLCWSWLVAARRANAQLATDSEPGDAVAAALDACRKGLRLARSCGFGIHAIDLLLEQAQTLLFTCEADDAEKAARLALYGTASTTTDGGTGASHAGGANAGEIYPSSSSTLSAVLAATHADCSYEWGIARGLQLLAEASLLRIATTLGSMTVAAGDRLAEAKAGQIAAARSQLAEAAARQGELTDRRARQTRMLLTGVDAGILTQYPVIRPTVSAGVSSRSVPGAAPPRVLISYAHADNNDPDPARRWLDRLLQQVTPLVRQRDLSIWSDRDIAMGQHWHDEIGQSLDAAVAAVLLVSPAYLQSEYVYSNELPVLLKHANDRGLPIIPIILRPCLFAETRFRYPDPVAGPEEFTLGSLQTANVHARPLSAMTEPEQDEVLIAVARRLLALSSARVGPR